MSVLLPITQLSPTGGNFDYAEARKVIESYVTIFKELEEVCQMVLNFSNGLLDEEKFLSNMDVLTGWVDDCEDFVPEEEKVHLLEVKAQLQMFISCFNQLSGFQRIIIYYSFFKKESALKISQIRLDERFKYGERTINRRIIDASVLLIKKLEWHKLKQIS